MKNILTKIEFHYTYLILALSFILTGYFSNLIIFTIIIIIHELGHYFSSLYYNIKVNKIIIYPYGGITKIDSLINLELNKELVISSMGFIFQWILFLIINILFKYNIIREYNYLIFKTYHYSIFFFNILPIYPLDGSKILNILLNKVSNYHLTNIITIIISFISLIIFVIFNKYNYLIVITFFLLFDNIIKFFHNLNYLDNKFLLERYLYNFKFKDLKIINNRKKMMKNKRHLIKNKDKYLKEDEFLHKLFDTKNIL